jgi:hypothetical protein
VSFAYRQANSHEVNPKLLGFNIVSLCGRGGLGWTRESLLKLRERQPFFGIASKG